MAVRVGFIGLGAMGKGMAKNIVKAGYDTVVHDRRPQPVEELSCLGVKVGESPKAVAAISDVIISMVRNDEQTEEVIGGNEGVLQTAKADCTIIIMSTVMPSLLGGN